MRMSKRISHSILALVCSAVALSYALLVYTAVVFSVLYTDTKKEMY